MPMKAILVIDFGTSNVHANLISAADGGILASASEKYPILSPAPGCTEIDPEQLWTNSVRAARSVMEKAKEQGIKVAALSFSYFGDNLIPVDQNGMPVHHCILSFDARGQEQANAINAALTPQVLTQTIGTSCEGFHTSAKILYLKQEMPEVYGKTAYFYTTQQLVNHRLGLPPLNDKTMACRKNLYDLERHCWARPLLEYIGITEEQLGAVVPSGTVIGSVERYGDVALGDSVPVTIGGHDCDMGILGLGLLGEAEDCIADITGTYDHLGYLADGTVNLRAASKDAGMLSYIGPLPDTSVCLGAFPTSGALLEWFMREIVGDTSQAAYAALWDSAAFDGMGTVRVSPQMMSSQVAFAGIGLSTKRSDLFKAVIETLTFETRRIVDECERTKKGTLTRVKIGGGAAQSKEWMQLRADITGKIFERMANIEVSSLGAAMLAAASAGIHPDMARAGQAMVHVKDRFVPNPEVNQRYETKYQAYITD